MNISSSIQNRPTIQPTSTNMAASAPEEEQENQSDEFTPAPRGEHEVKDNLVKLGFVLGGALAGAGTTLIPSAGVKTAIGAIGLSGGFVSSRGPDYFLGAGMSLGAASLLGWGASAIGGPIAGMAVGGVLGVVAGNLLCEEYDISVSRSRYYASLARD